MNRILHDMVNGKMNFRKAILWTFLVAFLLVLLSMLWSVGRAVDAVCEDIVADPKRVEIRVGT